MKVGVLASLSRSSLARVVFPAPLGPAMIIMRFYGSGFIGDAIGHTAPLSRNPATSALL